MLKNQLEEILLKVQKPSQYIGGEINSITKDKTSVDCRWAFCFPDTYEIGMSHLGMKILYSLLNARDDVWCERVFAPWIDFEQHLREHKIPLYALESLEPINTFDIIGFTLQYEMSYTNILNMLDLAGIPLKSADRSDFFPLVIAGGPCACNPEPITDFIDLFLLGEGEEVTLTLTELFIKAKKEGLSKQEFLLKASKLDGVYVPSLYDVSYNNDGSVKEITPKSGAPKTISKVIIKNLDEVFYPKEFVIPFTETVHDRTILEVMRGCIRGCRFCQAGFIYRPLREKNSDTLCSQGKDLCSSSGYEEISLSSLSTSDYNDLPELLNKLISYTEENKINLSLPSLRIDNFSEELVNKMKTIRKSGLTFAPEAGSQRLRDVINKNIVESDVLKSCRIAFEGGYTNVKLYFMLGLPTETMEDMQAILDLAQAVVEEYFSLQNRPRGKGVSVTVSVSTFVPKPHTPFQWEPQDLADLIREKQEYLRSNVKSKKISVNWHKVSTSILEGAFARGDRRLGEVLYKAWENGCRFDSWSEMFNFEKWQNAFDSANLDISFYANRKREYDEVLPWEHIDFGVSKDFLVRESKRASEAKTTPNCRDTCANCGADKLKGGKCF